MDFSDSQISKSFKGPESDEEGYEERDMDKKLLNDFEIEFCFENDIGIDVLANSNLKMTTIAKSKIMT